MTFGLLLWCRRHTSALGRSIYVIVLWEFASAVTPSVVGGSAVATFILHKEGIKLGKALAYVMVTAIMDNLFFVILAPIIMYLAQGHIFPNSRVMELQVGSSLEYLFWVSYSLYAIYSLLMAAGLFFRPRVFKWILLRIFSLMWLRKWKHNANEYGDQIIDDLLHLRFLQVQHRVPVTFLITGVRQRV